MENSSSSSSKTPNVPAAPWTTEGKIFVGVIVFICVLVIVGVIIFFVSGGGGGGKNVLKGYIDISSLQLTQDTFKDAWLNKKDIKINEIQLYPDYKYLAYANTTPNHLWVGKEPPPDDNRLAVTLNGVTTYVADDHHFVDVSQYGECFSTSLNALTFKKNGSECVADKCLSSFVKGADGKCGTSSITGSSTVNKSNTNITNSSTVCTLPDPHAATFKSVAGGCVVDTCKDGYKPNSDNSRCVLK